MGLPLEDLLFDGADSQKPVDEALLFLPVSPDPGHCLLVVGGVPIRIEHHQSVGPNEVEAAASCLAGQHEDELGAGRVIELKVNKANS